MRIRWKAIVAMTVSYIPWVIYWMLSAFSLRIAPVISLVAVTILLVPEILKKKISAMDIVAFIYLIIALVFNFKIGVDLFIKGDGYLGYATLFLMAIVSIICGHPFGMYYIAMEEVAMERSRLRCLGYEFSVIWMFVFFISAIIFYCINVPALAIVLSNVFVLIGIVCVVLLLGDLE